MSDIKSVIQLLCQHLNLLLEVNLRPDNFRLAKFNNNDEDTIRELWATLKNICVALGPSVPFTEKCNIQMWVKLQMAFKGYNSIEFYNLPHNCSRGSRELLLTLMWIIAKENALVQLTQDHVRQSPLCHEYSDEPKTLHTNPDGSLSVLKSKDKEDLSQEDQINYCLWLAARIKNNLNQIHDFEEERIKYTHQVHQGTSGASGLPHLSVFETKLIREPALLEKWMPKLTKLHELLDIHSKWLKKKLSFWEWMDSVVQLKSKEVQENSALQLSQESAFLDFVKFMHQCAKGAESKAEASKPVGFPRFFISSCLSKSSSNLVRKASSSDLLADLNVSENGIVIQASDWMAQIDTEIQDVEKQKHEKMEELNTILQSLTQKLGLVAFTDVHSQEVESEDCSK